MADVPDAPALHARLLNQLNPPYIRETGETAWVYVEDALPARTALRAVMELHVPELFAGVWACLACSPGMPPPILVLWADCATVAAAASALGVEVPDA